MKYIVSAQSRNKFLAPRPIPGSTSGFSSIDGDISMLIGKLVSLNLKLYAQIILFNKLS